MEYISVRQVAENWGVSVRQVQALLKDNRVKGAVRFDNHAWSIPADAEKPDDPRFKKNQPLQKSLSSELAEIITITARPLLRKNPDAVLGDITDVNLRLFVESYLSYLRGDFEWVKQCYRKIGSNAVKLRACPTAIAAAMSTGDYPLFQEIESYCKDIISAEKSAYVTAFAEFILAVAYANVFAVNMIPEWLKDGDFSSLPVLIRPEALCGRTRYLHFSHKFESVLDVARTALTIYEPESGLSHSNNFQRLMCAAAYCSLGRLGDAKSYLLDVMRDCLPHGFITPFAELMPLFGGVLELLLERDFPAYYSTVTEQSKRIIPNWLDFHNHFTKNNITLILSPREYQMARLAARGVPFKKIADQYNITLGTFNNNMQIIYQKLFISGKKDLPKYIL